jgi:uncharacterized protein
VTSPRWQPLRRLDIAGLALTMEDTDPYRDCYQAPAADRLTDETAVAWLRTIEEAWTVIRAEVPGQCDSLRGALRTIVPLRPEPGDDRRSGTARKAFGAIAVARTADAEVLAELMVHEVQHVKLGAVLDALDLIEPGSPARFRVGWRPDLRPMEGVLQGAYAHFGVADMWRARRDADRPGAETTYRMYRGWTEEAADALRSSGGLTASGMVFVESMIESINAWK